jgi:hypothetical protein
LAFFINIKVTIINIIKYFKFTDEKEELIKKNAQKSEQSFFFNKEIRAIIK